MEEKTKTVLKTVAVCAGVAVVLCIGATCYVGALTIGAGLGALHKLS